MITINQLNSFLNGNPSVDAIAEVEDAYSLYTKIDREVETVFNKAYIKATKNLAKAKQLKQNRVSMRHDFA